MRTGTCRWCGKPDREDLKDGTALLEIVTSQGVKGHYWIYSSAIETHVMKMGTRTVYSCNLRTGWCDCPDHQKTGNLCKHVKALRVALPRVS